MLSIGRATCPSIYLFIEIKLLTPASDLHKYVFSSHFLYLCFLHILRANFTDDSILKFKCSGPRSPSPGLNWAWLELISNQDQGMVNEVQAGLLGSPWIVAHPPIPSQLLMGPEHRNGALLRHSLLSPHGLPCVVPCLVLMPWLFPRSGRPDGGPSWIPVHPSWLWYCM